MEIYVKNFIFPYFIFDFKKDFIRCVDFSRITVLNTVTDNVTN